MNFKFTKILLFSSILFTSVMNWDTYSMNSDVISWGAYSIDLESRGYNIDSQTVNSKIREIAGSVQSDHKNCGILMRETNGDQLNQTLALIENNLKNLIRSHGSLNSDFRERQKDLLDSLIANSEKKIENAQEEYKTHNRESVQDLNSSYYQYYGDALHALYQDFTKNKYLIIQTALTVSKYNNLLEKIHSMSEDSFEVHFSDGFNAKKMLLDLFFYNCPAGPSFQDDPTLNEKKVTYLVENINNKLFEAVTFEKLQHISSSLDYFWIEQDEKNSYEAYLNAKMSALRRDLYKILTLCLPIDS